jgi:hypothetical protein
LERDGARIKECIAGNKVIEEAVIEAAKQLLLPA